MNENSNLRERQGQEETELGNTEIYREKRRKSGGGLWRRKEWMRAGQQVHTVVQLIVSFSK